MNTELAGQIYGPGPLADAYLQIEELRSYSTQMQRAVSVEDVTDKTQPQALDFDFQSLEELKMAAMDAVEDSLLEASESSQSRIPKYEGSALLLGYSAYLGAIHPELAEAADKITLNVLSLRPGVPIITRAYTYPKAGVIISDSPSIALRYDGEDTHRLNVYDDSEIFFVGEAELLRSDGLESYLTLDKREMVSMIVGSKAVNSYLTYLDSNCNDRLLRELSLSFASIYKPNEDALDDDLVGSLDLNLA